MITTVVVQGRSPLRRMLASLRPVRGELSGAAVLGALATICAIGLLGVSGWLISRASQMPPVLTLEVAIVAVRAFGIGRGFFRYAERLVSHDAVFRALTDLRVAVWRRLEVLAPQGLAGFRRGDLLARMVADVDSVQDLALRVVLPVCTAVLAGGCSVLVTWWLLPAAGAVLLAALLAGATLVPWLTTATGARAEQLTAGTRGELSAQVRELFRGAPDLVACGAAPAALVEADRADARLTRLARSTAWTSGLGAGLGVVLAGVAVLGALVAALPAVADGRLDGVNLAVVVLLPLAAYEAVASLPAAALALVRVRASADRLVDVLDTPDPMTEPPHPVPRPDGPADLRLRGLTASWGAGGEEVLHGIDLDLPEGRRVAVVGTSGAGKSTLVSVLVRFVEYSGSATLAGVELRDLAADDVRRSVVLCAQDAHVFDSTVAANLRIADPTIDDDGLLAALDRVGLGGFVAGLPHGLDTPVGEHGSRLSGGQRRRLVVARALLADAQVLVLDEPTEHLDEETAAALLADLLVLTENRTTLLVSHRLSGLEGVDEIVVLESGVVVERGTHAELVASEGVYAERWTREQEQARTLALAVVMDVTEVEDSRGRGLT
jgi:thiol reductant ABC exporter CydC subunit